MSDNIKIHLVDRLNRALSAWKQMRPSKRFGGLTVDEFEMELHKAAQARLDLVDAEKQYNQYKIPRDLANRHITVVLQQVVNSIKGDPAESSEGELYRACGYIPMSEGRRGARAKRHSAAASAPSLTPSATTVAPGEPTQPRLAA